jgi:hypothetical protein
MSSNASSTRMMVQEWRAAADEKFRQENIRDELHRAALTLASEHKAVLEAWNVQRATSENVINVIVEEVNVKKQELTAMEKETMALSDKIKERRKKIDDDKRIIQLRDEEADRKIKTLMEKEAKAKIHIKEFREARDVAQAKLKKTIEAAEAAIPREQEEHQRRVAAIRTKTEEIENLIVQEAKQWDVECASREYEALHTANRALEAELKNATDAKLMWSEALQSLSHQSNRSASISNELAQLRRMIATD